MKNQDSKHTFAIHVSTNLSGAIKDSVLELRDPALRMRITTVLRLESNESLILFDRSSWVRILINPQTFEQKKALIGIVVEQTEHNKLACEINLAVGLTKKEAFEEIAYFAAQMGASRLVPLITEKTHRRWGGEKEIVRMHNIMIAAAEQSKQFVLPKIEDPVSFLQFTETMPTQTNFYFDVHGKPLLTALQEFAAQKNNPITLLFGPEGGFSPAEIELLENKKCQCVVLTSSVLRTQEAVAVGLGSISSIANNRTTS